MVRNKFFINLFVIKILFFSYKINDRKNVFVFFAINIFDYKNMFFFAKDDSLFKRISRFNSLFFKASSLNVLIKLL